MALLLLAAALRFPGLGWGLRHRPPLDERFFVSNTALMLARGDLDHGFYQYPGLFYYVLAPVLALLDDPMHDPKAFLTARVLVACFSVATVALAYVFGRRLFGTATGLFAAALVAVSPLEVRIAHEVRPDVLLECATLAAFLAFRRIGQRPRGDIVAGVSIGVATALKFSGALVAASYFVQRALTPGPKLRRLVLVALVSFATFAVLSPYTFIRGSASLQGMDDQLSFHYVDRAGNLGFAGTLLAYLQVLVEALGVPALVLVLAGLVVGRREWRTWLPLLVLPVVIFVVFSTATITQDRFLLPTLAVVAVLAGPAAQALAARTRMGTVALAVAIVAVPLAGSIDYVRAIRRPITRDIATDWIESHFSSATVATTINAGLGLDPSRFEALRIGLLNPRTRFQALHADLVVTGPGAELGVLAGLKRVFVAEPETRYSGDRLRIFAVPPELKPRYEALDIREARLSASQSGEGLEALRDGDSATTWRTTGNQAPGDWVQIDLPQQKLLGRIEIVPPADAEEAGDEIEIFATDGNPKLSHCTSWPGRPPISQQRPPVSQVFLLPGVRAVSIRLIQVGRKAKPWGIAELRLAAYLPVR